ncbi:hypothetical protein DSO57_1000116 [Entomophthora muscae]|uniref:Uncharacterized protein n=1 Tax=Entomophthora muscae TaxID=34485 RepID=A0ACC2SML9_9FUNG|nr:hypothetical protein DSO57_1000116 [Entomophthora muscae]
MRHLDSFKEKFDTPFPDYKKATAFNSTEFKRKTTSKKIATGSIPMSNDPNNNRTCYKCGQFGHLSWYYKKPKANILHIGPYDSKENNKPSDDNKNEDEKESKTAKQSDPTAKELSDKEDSLMDLDASTECYLPEKEEVNKDLLLQVLAVNAVIRRQAIRIKALPLREAIETVSIPYAEQLSHPSSEVTHESDSIKNWHKYYAQYKSQLLWRL